MAKKRGKNTRRKRKKSTKRPDMILQLMKVMGALGILVLLVVSAAILAHFMVKRPQGYQSPSVQLPAPPPAPKIKKKSIPAYEVYTRKPVPPKPVEKLPQLPGDRPPLVAIIIDDIGYDRKIAKKLMTLDAPLTFSVLPDGPFSRQLADDARSSGREIMLHLPMEPKEYPEVDPGPVALLSRMTPDELIGQLGENLDLFAGLKGVNNHMGSNISTSPERMRQIFSILKKRDLYYVDSRTTAETVAKPSAKLLQLRFAERDIFIDHFEDEGFIRNQLQKLVERAKQQGYAVGIAHPHPMTYKVMAQFLPLIKKEVELVPASMVVDAGMQAELAKVQAKP